MNVKFIRKSGLLFFLTILCVGGFLSQSSFAGEGKIIFGHSEISILTEGQAYKINAEVADTYERRARGLMFRRKMSDQDGMLFLFEENQMVMMWMKNTFIPLDIIFINKEGVIVHIAKSTVPESLDIISSKFPVVSALELNAGLTDHLGIKIGHKIKHPFFTAASR